MVQARPHLLFLCHRIPYPPDKGDKIRSYHWLTALAERFRVHLGAFIDDPADWQQVAILNDCCETTCFLPLPRWPATLRSLSGFLSGEALTLPYYRDRRMQRWVSSLGAALPIRHVLVYSSAMGQYVDHHHWSAARRVVDFVDVDSDKWRQYAETRPWPARWVYGREAGRLALAEARLAARCHAALLVSEVEAQLFRTQVPGLGGRVHGVPNGVDTAYFEPEAGRQSPFPADCEAVVFTGAMDYWANVDAVLWFAREVWPRVRAERPWALLGIVGARPSPEVTALRGPDILVTGRVPDVRPFLQHAAVVVAPMRVARGIQNKVLEGMAMARPVVVTSKGLEGIAATAGRDIVVADDAVSFADAVIELLRGGDAEMGRRARSLVESRYTWTAATDALLAAVCGGADVPGR